MLSVIHALIASSGAESLNSLGAGGRSPLHLACVNKHSEVALALIECGCNVHLADEVSSSKVSTD